MIPEITLYRELLADIKMRVRQAQHRAMLSANEEMIFLYWDIGCLISSRQEQQGWGAGVIPRLATDLKNELPEEKGFSETNLKRMVQFSREYPGLFLIGARPVPQLPTALKSLAPPTAPGEIGAQPVPPLASLAIQNAVAQGVVAKLSWGHNFPLPRLGCRGKTHRPDAIGGSGCTRRWLIIYRRDRG